MQAENVSQVEMVKALVTFETDDVERIRRIYHINSGSAMIRSLVEDLIKIVGHGEGCGC